MEKETARKIRSAILDVNDDFEEWWEENKEYLSKDSELNFAMSFFEKILAISETVKKEQHDKFIKIISEIDCNLNNKSNSEYNHLSIVKKELWQRRNLK